MGSPINLEQAPPGAVVRFGMGLRRLLHRAGDRLVPAEVRAYELSISFFVTRVAGALADLGVIDAVGEGRRTAAELASELGLDENTLHRTLRLAAAQGIGRMDRRGRFSLTATGLALRSGASPTIGPWARHLNTESVQAAWAALPETIRTGEPSFPAVHGKSVWQHFAEHPEEEQLFASSMRELTTLTLAWIVAGYPWP
ncbi:MAG: methyltransferase family protein, partial [Solirubrobacterales bacterium]